MQQNKLDTIELSSMPDNSPAFRVTKSGELTFCIIPDLEILNMGDCAEKYQRLAHWATLMAKDLGLPVRFRVSLQGNSLDWEIEKGQHIQPGSNILN